jgi:hypothetical protein
MLGNIIGEHSSTVKLLLQRLDFETAGVLYLYDWGFLHLF